MVVYAMEVCASRSLIWLCFLRLYVLRYEIEKPYRSSLSWSAMIKQNAPKHQCMEKVKHVKPRSMDSKGSRESFDSN